MIATYFGVNISISAFGLTLHGATYHFDYTTSMYRKIPCLICPTFDPRRVVVP
jgi:hypothetical protein